MLATYRYAAEGRKEERRMKVASGAPRIVKGLQTDLKWIFGNAAVAEAASKDCRGLEITVTVTGAAQLTL
jgi:hypothetical protein